LTGAFRDAISAGTMAQSVATINRLLAAAAVATALLGSSACSPVIDNRGYVPDKEALERVKPGSQTRNDVADLLGTPSSVTPFSDNTWIYIQSRTSTIAFFDPKVLEQNVVVVDFDDAGIVNGVRRYTLEDGKLIDPVSRKTPAPGKELSFLEQLVGNVGKFNATRDNRR
jgi:outer membrane protein assembly factor BamE (lipoprotein component of BamABCDE complex)